MVLDIGMLLGSFLGMLLVFITLKGDNTDLTK
jgi:delta8-fatty-acid desaturase